MPTNRYILDANHEPIPCEDSLTWARWIEQGDIRIVEQGDYGPYFISTVFLGLDHNFGFSGHHKPLLFETMIFLTGSNDEDFDYQERCSTWDEALEQHKRAIEWCKEHARKTK